MNDLVNDFHNRLKSNDKELKKLFKNKDGAPSSIVSKIELEKLGKILEEYLSEKLQDYFSRYTPKRDDDVAPRTGQLLSSIRSKIKQSNGKLQAVVYFDDSGAFRDSLWPNQPQGYLPALINDGWQVKKGRHKNIPNFGYFEGIEFIESAVNEAKKDDRFKGIKFKIIKEHPF